MCGIVGVFSLDSSSQKDVIQRMADTLKHRGPDDAGVWSNKEFGISFGHRRLSVIDVSTEGRQPMTSSCGRYVIVFNGEIYNHISLRGSLDKLHKKDYPESGKVGFKWKGHSDTEILLACISAWGIEKALQVISGMFAFALWDNHEHKLILARDRFGEKPLYYGWIQNSFVFGSELKALRSFPGFNNKIDRDALALYFQFCAVPTPYSIYQNISKLEPGNYLVMKYSEINQKKASLYPYWKLVDAVNNGISNQINNEEEAIKELDLALNKSVSQQTIADMPLGAFLSGGIDSSLIVAMMQNNSNKPVRTFTVGFDESEFDESKHALLVANYLGTEHNEIRVTSDDAMAVIPLLSTLYDEPFSDSSQIPTYLVCKAASQHVTVALSGDAGDEMFGGYNRYFWGKKIWSKIGWIPPNMRGVMGSAIQAFSTDAWDVLGNLMPSSSSYNIARLGNKAHKLAYRLKTVNNASDLYYSLVTEWPKDANFVLGSKVINTKLDKMLLEGVSSNIEECMMFWDSLTYLPDDILTKVDRASMGVSLETRAPFLDHNIAELAWRLPLSMKIRNGKGKWALRQVLHKYVPHELIERPKAGFAVPVGQWLRGPLREWAEDLLEYSRINQEGYIDATIVQRIWREHLSGTADWTVKLWGILMFQSWLQSCKLDN